MAIVVSVTQLGILCHGLKLYSCPIKSRKAAIYHSYTTTEMENSLSVLFNKSSRLQYPLPGTYTIYYLLVHNDEQYCRQMCFVRIKIKYVAVNQLVFFFHREEIKDRERILYLFNCLLFSNIRTDFPVIYVSKQVPYLLFL